MQQPFLENQAKPEEQNGHQLAGLFPENKKQLPTELQRAVSLERKFEPGPGPAVLSEVQGPDHPGDHVESPEAAVQRVGLGIGVCVYKGECCLYKWIL